MFEFLVKRSGRTAVCAIIAIALLIGLAFAPGGGYAAGGEVSVDVFVQAPQEMGDGFAVAGVSVRVTPGLAAQYGYTYAPSVGPADVTTLDALVAAHLLFYDGDGNAVTASLELSDYGFIGKAFDIESYNWMTFVNGEAPNDGIYGDWGYTGLACNQAKIASGDAVAFYCQKASWPDSDDIVWFEANGKKAENITVKAGEPTELTLMGYSLINIFEKTEQKAISPIGGATVESLDFDAGATPPYAIFDGAGPVSAVSNADGKVQITLPAEGVYYLSAYYDGTGKGLAAPLVRVTATADGLDANRTPELTALRVLNNPGTLSPAFSPDVYSYRCALPAAVSSLSIGAVAASQYTNIVYSIGDAVYPGGGAIPVRDGTVIRVTATYEASDAVEVYYITISQDETSDPPLSAVGVPGIRALAADLAKLKSYEMSAVPDPAFAQAGGEWTIFALARSGQLTDAYRKQYANNLTGYVRERNGVLSSYRYTDYSRVDLALAAIGADPRDFAGYNLLAPLAEYDKVLSQGLNGPTYALLALDSKGYAMPDKPAGSTSAQAAREMYVSFLLSKQNPDGGWNLAGDPASASNPDITAMVLQALAPYRTGSASGLSALAVNQAAVAAALDKAVAALSDMQAQTGSFGTIESNAQVLIALTTLGIPVDDSRFVKNGRTVYDALMNDWLGGTGAFRLSAAFSTPDQISTDQGFSALASLYRYLTGMSSLYDINDSPAIEEEELPPTVPDVTPVTPAVTPAVTSSPNTGDDTAPAYAAYAFLLAALLLGGLILPRRRVQ
ncbi:MAG: hypothetical protein LBS85_00225 [Clostridiales Family XIII bacterium]|jgi:hypothetical protein|nr:hypothetical protein [Clostridiales Family XIII bacterium]